MGKRSDFPRRKHDAYPTPFAAVLPLLPFLVLGQVYAEPCAGDGALIQHLAAAGHLCGHRSDVETPAETLTVPAHCDLVITNPPWTRAILHPIIANLAAQRPTWLLFDADWIHTTQAAPYLPMLRKIVAIGRVKWIEGSAHAGLDNACWYLFDANSAAPLEFHGRSRIDRGVKA